MFVGGSGGTLFALGSEWDRAGQAGGTRECLSLAVAILFPYLCLEFSARSTLFFLTIPLAPFIRASSPFSSPPFFISPRYFCGMAVDPFLDGLLEFSVHRRRTLAALALFSQPPVRRGQ